MAIIDVLFHKGLNGEARSCLTKPGYLRQSENIQFKTDGIQTLRPMFSNINTTALGPIVSTRSLSPAVFAIDEDNLYGRIDSNDGDFTLLTPITHSNVNQWSWAKYKDFIFAANGETFFMVDRALNTYDPQIPNPLTKPSGAPSGGGTITGTYGLYVSYLLTFPNRTTYETGLSPVSDDVTVSSDLQIDWTNIPLCPYVALYGEEPVIWRNLYRGPGSTGASLANIFYVGTIEDNSTTIYTDTMTEAEINASGICYVELYLPPPMPKFICFHYGIIFMIPQNHPNRLWYSEPVNSLDSLENESLLPLAVTVDNWDDFRSAGFDEFNPMGIIAFGVNLYIPLINAWIRKQGNDPETWGYKKTYTKSGLGASSTLSISNNPLGMIGLSNPEFGEPTLGVFTGQDCQPMSAPKLDFIFGSDLDQDNIIYCQGLFTGPYYHFIYPSIDNTDKHLVIDNRRSPDIRAGYWTGLNSTCIAADQQNNEIFIGGADGFVRVNSGLELIDVIVETNDLVGGEVNTINVIKTFKSLQYALKGTLTLQVYIDDVLRQWPDGSTSMTLTGIDETIQEIMSLPQDWQGYRFRLKLTGTALTELEIYSPWSVDLNIVGGK